MVARRTALLAGSETLPPRPTVWAPPRATAQRAASLFSRAYALNERLTRHHSAIYRFSFQVTAGHRRALAPGHGLPCRRAPNVQTTSLSDEQ